MATIYSIQGKPILVDDDDFEWLSQWRWTIGGNGYATASIKRPDGKRRTTPMHRLIMNTPTGMIADHINRLRDDNRRSNLRNVTHHENMQNKTPMRRTMHDPVTGKYWLLKGYELSGIYNSGPELHQAWIDSEYGRTPAITNTSIPTD